MSTHIPISITCLALCVFLAAQIGATQQGHNSLTWQATNQEKQIEALKDAGVKLGEIGKRNEALVKQSDQVQAQYTTLLSDVLELAKTDADAKKVVEKWKIQKQEPQPAPSPTPSVSTTPAH